MDSYLLSISPKGQITIPMAERSKFKHEKCLLEVRQNVFILKPVEITPIGSDTEDFASLAASSFEFWDNEADDIYQKYYESKTR